MLQAMIAVLNVLTSGSSPCRSTAGKVSRLMGPVLDLAFGRGTFNE
jgi:hypothetical protein